MKKFRSFAFLLTLVVLPVAVHAQGSGSSGSRPAQPRPSQPPKDVRDSTPERAFAVTSSVTGKILEVDQDQGIFVVEDKKGNRRELKLTAKTKLKGDKSKEAMMKKEETTAKEGGSMEEKEMMMKKSIIQSLHVGQNVKVKYLASDNTAIEIQLRN